MKVIHDDPHVLTGSYVLDAVSDAEREELERHLQHCPSCEAEVRGLRETAARLALARALTPPARMEQQVLAATYRTRQLPPLLQPGRRDDDPGHGEPGRGLAQAADLGPAAEAVLQVTLELLALRVADGVENVAAGKHVQIVTHDLHQGTSMQSRILISPSLIRVLTVPRATPSSFATCG